MPKDDTAEAWLYIHAIFGRMPVGVFSPKATQFQPINGRGGEGRDRRLVAASAKNTL